MMERSLGTRVLALFACLGLAGCVAQPSISVPVGTQPAATMTTISSNARSAGARAVRVGSNAVAITYTGAPRNYIACTRAGSPASTHGLALDARSEYVQPAGGSSVRGSTQYIVTQTRARQSIEFSDGTSAQFPSGLTCRATGRLPGRLLAQPAG